MGKKNTVRIDMEVFNRAIEAAGYASPKAFCELELGFSDGWYYTIRNHGGRGVKVLVAELIARRLDIDIDRLVISDKNGNPSVSEADSSFAREPETAGASPRPTGTVEEETLDSDVEALRAERDELREEIDHLIMRKARFMKEIDNQKAKLTMCNELSGMFKGAAQIFDDIAKCFERMESR